MGRKTQKIESRFRNWLSCGKGHLQDFPSDLFAYIDPIPTSTDECWIWIGGHSNHGTSPCVWFEGRMQHARRALILGYKLKLQLRKGIGPRCQNTSCVNPWHYDPIFRGKYNCYLCGEEAWVCHKTTTGKKLLQCRTCKRKFLAQESDTIPGWESIFQKETKSLSQKEKDAFLPTYWHLFREEQNEKWKKKKKYVDLLRLAWMCRISDAQFPGLSPEDLLILKEELEEKPIL